MSEFESVLVIVDVSFCERSDSVLIVLIVLIACDGSFVN